MENGLKACSRAPEGVADNKEGDVLLLSTPQDFVRLRLHHLAVCDRDLLSIELLLRACVVESVPETRPAAGLRACYKRRGRHTADELATSE